ncbi:DUF6705 family protein [Chryseobacterium sp. GP-SGM7]|uniref:DUF6705 family protein n=1 Tax=Chryseobacterium sp. GP-SGM7 TaxID=3411323 RepID=UPI003B93E03D
MKSILFILLMMISCKSFPQSNCQTTITVPFRTYNIQNKECYYFKDTHNELPEYEGTWKGTWNNKTLVISFTKMTNIYSDALEYNRDYLAGKFKTLDNNGNILFNNLNLQNNEAKIRGINFQETTNKYIMSYTDNDLCGIGGSIKISFANTAKTQLNLDFDQDRQIIDTDCYYYSYPPSQYPEPLPKNNIVLIKQ